ncbi:hypothetical protein Amir_1290 [Actinosynnema mirum DSM 43827]|uniref:Uncharacterized protein n=1 Tax=Actinosynnema mirum (strain ATCC 29888 / DSM 43827 / JCM 3225 / NBRC 14064 / NCIMB 13271 / NRRL B-12336 / IMRU 3971 / 101) TaxID=446462 RepID=C6WRJ0_ACTMD|nr:hypothetical protein Amir_1290 [Actinosynnema mirum DSM 43827]
MTDPSASPAEDRADAVDVQTGVTKRVVSLRRKKAESAQLRGLVDDPDMVAVRIEAQRRLITRGMWFFLTLGLGFTAAGVQDFLAGHRPVSDPLWWAAWLAEPMLAGILIMLLVFESEVLHRGVPVDSVWVERLKRTLLGSTLFMNVWPTLAPAWTAGERFEFGNFAVHLVVPLVVFMVAEVMPVVQERMNQAITRAYRNANTTPAPPPAQTTPVPAAVPPPPAAPTPPAPVAPAPPAPAPAAVAVPRLKLPPAIVTAVRAKADQVAAQGRDLTAEDVQAAVRLPAEMAERVVLEVRERNSHALT